jgi:molecular chaperone GrpE
MADDNSRWTGEVPPQAADEDEIEITEIQGLPADAPPPAAGVAPEPRQDEDPAAEGAAQTAAGQEGGDLESLRAELQQAQDEALRVRADFENYRKRQVRERADFARHAAADLVASLLPVLDNFNRALALEPAAEEAESYREGIRLIHRQLAEALAGAGLAPIETDQQPFDPSLHEAVAREETDAVPPNTITAELEPGYRFRDRLLKPARVRVAVAPREPS